MTGLRWSEAEYEAFQAKRKKPVVSSSLLPIIDKKNSEVKAPLEEWEQLQVVNWCKERGVRVHHSPNGGKRSKAEAGMFKAQGVSPGFPDLIIFPKAKCQPVLFIEMKRVKGSTVSEEQKEWVSFLNSFTLTHSFKSFICKGHQAAIQILIEHGY